MGFIGCAQEGGDLGMQGLLPRRRPYAQLATGFDLPLFILLCGQRDWLCQARSQSHTDIQ